MKKKRSKLKQLVGAKPANVTAVTTEDVSVAVAPGVNARRTAITGIAKGAISRLRQAFESNVSYHDDAEPTNQAMVEFVNCDEVATILVEQPDVRLMVIYESPWEAALSANENELSIYLDEWLRRHTELLRLRHQHPEQILLVNAKRLDDSSDALNEEIGHAGLINSDVDGSSSAITSAAPAKAALARNFDWFAPEYWDAYEALESCAWLGNGEPEYRDSTASSDGTDIAEVAAIWQRASQLPDLIRGRDAQLAESEQKAAADRSTLAEITKQRDELREQLERLQAQFDNTRTELDRQSQEVAKATNAQAAEIGQLQEKCATLEGALQAMTSERDSLKKSLDDAANAAKQREEKLQASVADQKRAADQREEASQAELHKVTEQAKESAAEAELLLAQLHQVQESLESMFIEGQEAAKQAADMRGQLEKDKESLAQQIKMLQAELKNGVDTANALKAEKVALTAQITQVQAEKTAAAERSKKLEAELAAKANAATAIERDLKSKLDTLEARAKEAEAQAIQHADKLKAAATEAEKQQALYQAEKAKLAAETKRLTEELIKASGKASAAEAELQQRTKTAAEEEGKLRETITSLEARAKEAESEAELLLLQLHHVQEELENYFIKSRDATIALEKSTESFNRARHVVTQLVKLRAA